MSTYSLVWTATPHLSSMATNITTGDSFFCGPQENCYTFWILLGMALYISWCTHIWERDLNDHLPQNHCQGDAQRSLMYISDAYHHWTSLYEFYGLCLLYVRSIMPGIYYQRCFRLIPRTGSQWTGHCLINMSISGSMPQKSMRWVQDAFHVMLV